MSLRPTWREAVTGLVIYATGDTLASLILDQFQLARMLGVALVGATLYTLEIPAYFRWIDRRHPLEAGAGGRQPLATAFTRTLLAQAYFNPLWIARHLFFLALFSGRGGELGWALLGTALLSFLGNIPLSLVGNYVIQVRLPLRWRFAGSAAFSGLMAVYYACSAVWFGS